MAGGQGGRRLTTPMPRAVRSVEIETESIEGPAATSLIARLNAELAEYAELDLLRDLRELCVENSPSLTSFTNFS